MTFRDVTISGVLPTVFFDIEASSLGPASWPIEVGWATVAPDLSVTATAILIRPEPDWLDWSAQAQGVHGIDLAFAREQGRPASQVAQALNEAFDSGVVFSDACEWEAHWTRRLYDAVGVRRTWRIGDALPLLRATASTPSDNHWLSAHLSDTRLHRADADALVLAEAYCELRRRRGSAASNT